MKKIILFLFLFVCAFTAAYLVRISEYFEGVFGLRMLAFIRVDFERGVTVRLLDFRGGGVETDAELLVGVQLERSENPLDLVAPIDVLHLAWG